jgi:hypothetical protein
MADTSFRSPHTVPLVPALTPQAGRLVVRLYDDGRVEAYGPEGLAPAYTLTVRRQEAEAATDVVLRLPQADEVLHG